MNDRQSGPRSGDTLGGVVLMFFGLCIFLVGGGCTFVWVMIMFTDRTGLSGNDGWAMLLISIVAAAAGLFAFYKGMHLFRGKRG